MIKNNCYHFFFIMIKKANIISYKQNVLFSLDIIIINKYWTKIGDLYLVIIKMYLIYLKSILIINTEMFKALT